jgi:uncharacterized LabA/DUF88 family protein
MNNPGLFFMKPKTFLFIDSSNAYHSLRKSGAEEFFDYPSLHKELSIQFDIQKTFFYDAIKSRQIEPEQYTKQQIFHEKLTREIKGLEVRKRKLKYLGLGQRIQEGLKELDLCRNCYPKVINFLSKLGLFKVSKEKGIDILLGSDMIKAAYENKFDSAIIFSGDADFVPAIEVVKELKKKVINLHLYEGSSSELRQKCDSHILVSFDSKGQLILKEQT